jgi:hypothetical protein
MVAHTSADDWNVISCWGANSGPSFLDQFSVWTSSDGWGLEHDSHFIRAAYVHNVSLGVASGLDYMRRPDGGAERLTFEWAKNFPDHDVTGSWVDVLWNGMLAYRQLVLVVDGGRAILPAPRGFFVPTGPAEAELVGETVTQRQAEIARVGHSFEHHLPGEFDRYLGGRASWSPTDGCHVRDDRLWRST